MNYPFHPHRRPPVPLVARVYQQENQRLRQENAWLRNEIRHYANVIESMGHDMEARRREFVLGELSRVDTHGRTVVVDQRRLLEVHLREQLAAELEDALLSGFETGYKAGLADGPSQRRRLTGDS